MEFRCEQPNCCLGPGTLPVEMANSSLLYTIGSTLDVIYLNLLFSVKHPNPSVQACCSVFKEARHASKSGGLLFFSAIYFPAVIPSVHFPTYGPGHHHP